MKPINDGETTVDRERRIARLMVAAALRSATGIKEEDHNDEVCGNEDDMPPDEESDL